MTFQDIQAEFSRGARGVRKLGNNTYLLKQNDNIYAMRYHNTEVVTYTSEHIEFNTGGWFTLTTKERLNWGVHLAKIPNQGISSKNRVWYYGATPFFDGLRIDYQGNPINAQENSAKVNKEIETKAKIRKLVSAYIRDLKATIEKGTLTDSGAGDCWWCKLRGQDGKTIGESFKDKSHLVSHLKQKYFMVSLCYNALQKRGYRYPEIFILAPDEGNPSCGHFDIKTAQNHIQTIIHSVRYYFNHELLDTPIENLSEMLEVKE